MQNSEGENKVHHGLYESSAYKRCKVCKIKLFDGQPGSKVSQELCGVT